MPTKLRLKDHVLFRIDAITFSGHPSGGGDDGRWSYQICMVFPLKRFLANSYHHLMLQMKTKMMMSKLWMLLPKTMANTIVALPFDFV